MLRYFMPLVFVVFLASLPGCDSLKRMMKFEKKSKGVQWSEVLSKVPEGSVAVAAWTEKIAWPDGQEEKRKKVDAYLKENLGVNFLEATSGILFASFPMDYAAVLTLKDQGPLLGESLETYKNVEIVMIQRQPPILGAMYKGQLILGSLNAIKTFMAVDEGSPGMTSALESFKPAFTWADQQSRPFGFFLKLKNNPLLGMVPQANEFRMDAAILAASKKGFGISVQSNDPEQLRNIQLKLEEALAKAGKEAEGKEQEFIDRGEPLSAAIVMASQAWSQSWIEGFTPKMSGKLLTYAPSSERGNAMTTAAIVGILSAVAIPAFLKYIKKSKTAEARTNVRRMYDGAWMFFDEERFDENGKPLPKGFPESVGPTPSEEFCGPETKDNKFIPNPEDWEAEPWKQLRFALEQPHHYKYEFVSEGEGTSASFTARAFGDLDCDGVTSLFERVGSVDPETGEFVGGAGLYVAKDIE